MLIGEDLDFKQICNNLSEEDILKVRASEAILKYHINVLIETMFEEQALTNTLITIYNFIKTLLERLNGPLPEDYVVPIMDNW